MYKDLKEWETKVKAHNVKLEKRLKEHSNYKDLFYGFNVIDGKLIAKPEILIIGINPGSGDKIYGKNDFETERLSYLDVFNDDYRDDYPNTYHLAEKTIKIFRAVGWSEEKIKEAFKNKVLKTNFYHLITAKGDDINTITTDISYKSDYDHQSAEFAIQLINLTQPKLLLLEGKRAFDAIVKECYEENVWNKDNFGYLYDKPNNTHIFGYARSGFTNENHAVFVEKLKEILN